MLIFKATIKANSETNDAKIVNLFSFTLRDIMSNWCNNYMGDYLDYIFAELQLVFVKGTKKLRMMNKFNCS
jgi:hypothetical protein